MVVCLTHRRGLSLAPPLPSAIYTYNAWGECTVINYTSANIGNINPFRYRGYYYDTETGFYYLNARYYDPVTKRFISADSIGIIGATPDALTDKNLYAYCDNNPIMRFDDGGEFWHIVAGAFVGAVADGAIGVVAGFVGGAGASHGNSKTAMTLGKQLSKRIWRTREVSKAFAYYSKNMMNGARKSIYTAMCKGIIKSNISSIFINSGRSVYG